MTVCTDSRDRRRGTGRKRKGEMRSEGERWLARDTDKRKQNKKKNASVQIYAHVYSSSENPPISDYRKMPHTSLVRHTVVMATQAGLASRRVSGEPQRLLG